MFRKGIIHILIVNDKKIRAIDYQSITSYKVIDYNQLQDKNDSLTPNPLYMNEYFLNIKQLKQLNSQGNIKLGFKLQNEA